MKFLETTQVHFVRPHTACVHYKYFAANMYIYIVQILCEAAAAYSMSTGVTMHIFSFCKKQGFIFEKMQIVEKKWLIS